MNIDKKFFSDLKKRYLLKNTVRRELIGLSSEAQHLAKQAIFALQQNKTKEALVLIKESTKKLKQGEVIGNKVDEIETRGSFRQAQEEWVEAQLFYKLMTGSKIGDVSDFKVPLEVYLGGLTDTIGEAARYAVTAATQNNIKLVHQLDATVKELMGELVTMNLTGYLRNKFDQSKNALRKLEGILYDLSLKSK